jgi:superfamily II DNA or RNA helicase
MTAADHEREFVKAFVPRERRERWLELLANPKQRQKITLQLAHNAVFRSDRIVAIEPRQQHAKPLSELLTRKGAPELCYVISESEELDGREMLLVDALKAIVGYGMGSIVSCIPGRLAYYEAEGPKERFILQA